MTEKLYGAEAFLKDTGVSRETLERLKNYAALLEKWQARINLVGPATLPHLWQRHMLDSAQLIPLAPAPAKPRVWIDLGAGAGFPGLVIAIMTGDEVHLCEANTKKCVFLREVVRTTGCRNVTIHNRRIEEIEPFAADIIVARAFAPLPKLLEYAAPFFDENTVGLFLKGQYVDDELTEATKYWNISTDQLPSRSDDTGKILKVRSVQRAG